MICALTVSPIAQRLYPGMPPVQAVGRQKCVSLKSNRLLGMISSFPSTSGICTEACDLGLRIIVKDAHVPVGVLGIPENTLERRLRLKIDRHKLAFDCSSPQVGFSFTIRTISWLEQKSA
jgi:hypothetical protein